MAQTPAFEFTTSRGMTPLGQLTAGYSFDVLSPITVVGLGFFTNPEKGGNTLYRPHSVGLWDSSGNLLTSTTVSDSDTSVGHFKYSAISPIALAPGQGYRVAGYNSFTLDGDNWFCGNRDMFTGLFNVPEITNVQGASGTGPSLTFPDVTDGWPVYAAGNMLVAPVPEPATIAMLGIGTIALLRKRRKRMSASPSLRS